MKQLRLILSILLALTLLSALLVFGTGLLRFGWVDIPYKEATSITVTNTLRDGFAFEITDPHYVEHITTALDDFGPVFSTPADGKYSSLYELELIIQNTKSYSLSILDESHFLAQGRKCGADMKPILETLTAVEAEARAAQQEEDIQQAVENPSEGSGQELARDLEADPDAFFEQLAAMPMENWGNVCQQIADHHALNGTTDDYVTFLLNLYPTRYGDLHCWLLTMTYPSLKETNVPLMDAVLHALPYTDGAATEYVSQLLYDLFLLDGPSLIGQLAKQETDIQEFAVSQLVITSGHEDTQPPFEKALDALLNAPGLTSEAEALAQYLNEQWNASQKAGQTPTGYPTGTVQQPQIMYEGQIYYYTANGFDSPLPLGYLLVGAVKKVDNNDPPTENWTCGRVELGQAIYAKDGAESIYVEYESGYAEFCLRK